MTHAHPAWQWLDTGDLIGATELAQAGGITVGELQELVDYGALRPAATHEEQGLFLANCTMPLRAACRLRRDYDLDLFTVALLLEQLQHIEQLQHELRTLRAHLPVHASGPARDAPGGWREAHGGGG